MVGDKEDKESDGASNLAGTGVDDEEADEVAGVETKRGRGRRALKKMNRLVSGLMHGKTKATDGKKLVAPTVDRKQAVPSTPKPQTLRALPESPVKERLRFEVDHDIGQDKVNKEFFTPPRVDKYKDCARQESLSD